MDPLLTKVKELQPVYQTADEQVQQTRAAYFQAIETAYKQLQTLHTAQHELLVIVANQRHQMELRLLASQQEITRLQSQLETPVRPDNVAPVEAPEALSQEEFIRRRDADLD